LSHRILLTLAVLLLTSASLPAQVPDVSPGSRVRVRHPCGVPDRASACTALVGRAVRPAGDSLFVEDEHGVMHGVDLRSATRLERSAGYRRHTLLGLGLGALAGLGSGALLVSGCTQGGEDDGLCNLYYFVTIPAGAGIGALAGALTRTERWEPVSGSGPAVRVLPGVNRIAVVVTVR
jgi:hypothetical protein